MASQPLFTPKLVLAELRGALRPDGSVSLTRAGANELANWIEYLSRATVSRSGDGLGIGDRINASDIGEGGSSDPLTIGRKLVLESVAGRSITLDPDIPAVAVREGGFMAVFGAKFGTTDDIFWWVGGDQEDLTALTKAGAFEYRANESGQLVEGGSSGSGAINWSAQDNDAEVSDTVSVTHSSDGTTGGTTNGNDITVNMSYTLYRSGVYATDPGNASNLSADLILTRDYDGGGASSVATPSPTGTRVSTPIYYPTFGGYSWVEQISFSGQYTDSTGLTADRVFALELDALNNLTTHPPSTSMSVLTLSTSEPA